VRPLSVVRLRHEKGVMIDLGLSVRPSLLGLAGPQSLEPSLADIFCTTTEVFLEVIIFGLWRRALQPPPIKGHG
jgi:hypothetical protein